MKQKLQNVLGNLKSRLTGKKIKEQQVPVVLNGYSQPHVLQYNMREESLSHDEKVIADIGPVRLEQNLDTQFLYFCPMNILHVTKRIQPGDGLAIPAEAVLEEITVPKSKEPGLYMLRDVQLHSNGKISVKATAKTTWQKI